MTWITLSRLVLIATLAVTLPLLAIAGRVLYALYHPVPADVVALDVSILVVAALGMMAAIGMHMRQAVAAPLEAVRLHLDSMGEGHFDHRIALMGTGEQRELAKHSNELAASLERQFRHILYGARTSAMGTVVAGVAHEVSNPLAQMRLTLQTMAGVDDKQRAAIARLMRGTTRLAAIVETLRVAGARAGAHSASHILRAAAIAAQQSTLRLQAHVEDQATSSIHCLPSEVILALVALLENASDAATRDVGIESRDEGDQVVFHVWDDGPGLDPVIAAQATEAFVTTKPGRVGLGLAYVSQLAERLGGTLRLQHQDGRTHATLRLPAVATAGVGRVDR